MSHVPHELAEEFPDQTAALQALKAENAHFAKLVTEYEVLDREIIRIEEGIEHRSDEALEHLKMRRVQLKDELYAMLTAR